MKPKNFAKKLVLNKKTISVLVQGEMNRLKGGDEFTDQGVSLCTPKCYSFNPTCPEQTQDPTWYPMHPCCH